MKALRSLTTSVESLVWASNMVRTMPATLRPGFMRRLTRCDGFQQLADALQRQEVRLHGDDDLVGDGEGVEGQQAQARRAVEQHVVEVEVGGLEALLEELLAAQDADELDLGGGEVDRAGDEGDVVVDLVDRLRRSRRRSSTRTS